MLADPAAALDLDRLLLRAAALEEGAVRVQAAGRVLALTVPVLTPAGLLDGTPTVLGLRAAELAEPAELDRVVPLAELRAALAEASAEPAAGPLRVAVPAAELAVAWAGVAPPRDGWQPLGEFGVREVERIAVEGVTEVRAALPDDAGQAVLARVRAAIWGRAAEALQGLPAGAAFAAFGLGFLAPPETAVRVFGSGAWRRLGTRWGQVLCRSRTV